MRAVHSCLIACHYHEFLSHNGRHRMNQLIEFFIIILIFLLWLLPIIVALIFELIDYIERSSDYLLPLPPPCFVFAPIMTRQTIPEVALFS